MPFLWQSFDQNTWLKTLPAHLIFPPHSHLILPSADGNETSCVLRSLFSGFKRCSLFFTNFRVISVSFTLRGGVSQRNMRVYTSSQLPPCWGIFVSRRQAVFYTKSQIWQFDNEYSTGPHKASVGFSTVCLVFFYFNCKLIKNITPI